MFAALLMALPADPLITLECPGRPLKEVIAKLEPVIGHKVYVSAELAEQPVVLLLKNRSWSDLQKDLAWCLRATWKDETLARTDADNRARIEAARQQREADLQRYLSGVERRTAKWGKWTDSDLQNLVRGGFNPENENPRMISIQACLEILLTLGARTISSLPAGSYYAYPPQRGEKSFPNDCLPIVREAIENERKLAEYYPAPPKATPSQAALFFDNGEYTLSIADENGLTVDSVSEGESAEAPPIKADGTETQLELSQRTQEAIALRKSLGSTTLVPSKEIADAINNPLKVDPVELMTGDVLLAMARAEGREIVSAPNTLWTSRLAARARLPITSRLATALLMPTAEFERREGRMRVRSIPGLGLSVARAKLQEVINKIRGARTSQVLADAIFPVNFWPPEQGAELLLPQRFLNRSLEVVGGGPDIRPFLIGPRGTKQVVRMTAAMKTVISGLFRNNPNALLIERKVTGPRAGELPAGMIPRETYSLAAFQDLSALPLRAFPNGPPDEIEIEISRPGAGEHGGAPERCFVGMNADRALAKRMYAFEYGGMLRDFRAGARKDMPSHFWTYGEAGATVKIRFPGGYLLSLVAYAAAVHPNEEAKSISELPAEYLRQAEESSKQAITRRTPPPF